MAVLNNQPLTAEQEKEETRELRRQQSLERAIQKKETEAKSKKEGLAETAEAGLKKGVSMFTAQALKQAWLNLIDSFGLTLLYINFHFIAKYIVGSDKFIGFGEEWLPKAAGGKIVGGAIKWFEIIALFFLDIIFFILILISIILLLIPIFITIAPFAALKDLLGL